MDFLGSFPSEFNFWCLLSSVSEGLLRAHAANNCQGHRTNRVRGMYKHDERRITNVVGFMNSIYSKLLQSGEWRS